MSLPLEEARSAIAQLVSKVSACMPLPESEQFQANIKAGYTRLPLTVLVKGEYSPSQQFSIVRTALKELKEELEHNASSNIPWEKMWNICLDQFERMLSTPSITPKGHSRAEGQASSAMDRGHQSPGTAATTIRAQKSTAQSGPKKVPPKPNLTDVPTDQKVIRQIQEQVHADGSRKSQPYDTKGQRYVKCKAPGCRFCRKMFASLHLTSCERFGHEPCNSAGWFPHVGITMWKSLRRQHDAGADFITRQCDVKPGELPCLSSLPQSVSAPLVSPHKRPRNDGDVSPPASPVRWAEEMSDSTA